MDYQKCASIYKSFKKNSNDSILHQLVTAKLFTIMKSRTHSNELHGYILEHEYSVFGTGKLRRAHVKSKQLIVKKKKQKT